MTAPRPPVSARAALWLLAAMCFVPLALRILFALDVELSPDEAYYAAWARQPSLSYFDHPPMVAWMIAAGQAVLGSSELGVRAPGLLLGALLPWLLYGAARALGASRWSALWATAAASSTLLCSAGAVIITPDTPLSLFFATAVYFVARSLGGGSSNQANQANTANDVNNANRVSPANRAKTVNKASPAAWVVAGAVLALAGAFASKLTAVLLWGQAVLLPGLGTVRRRTLWLFALAGLGPVLAWNLAQDWPMFTFHAQRLAGRAGFAPNFAGEFLAAQLALLNLGPGLLVVAACARGLRRDAAPGLRAMVLWTLGPLAATTVLALFTKVEANWIAPAFLPAFVATALWLDGSALRPRWLAAATIFSAVATLVAHAHVVAPFLPLDPARDPSAQLHGGRALASAVRQERTRLGAALPVLASRYQEAALLSFYLPDPTVTTLPGGPRLSQFDFWPTPTRAAERALCVFREGEAPAAGRRLEASGQVFFLHLCRPAAWR